MRVLLVEDEVRLADNLAAALRDGPGFAVDWAADGEAGDDSARNRVYDLIILDLMLPRLDGLSLLRRLRARHDATPVLILTAKEGKNTIIELLNAGADDYLAKPFDLGELIARDVGEHNRIALVLTNIGEALLRLGRSEEAIKALTEAEGLCDETGDRLHLAEAKQGLAKAYLEQKDLKRARESIKRAVDLLGQVRSKPHLAVALRTLGEVTGAGAWGGGHEVKAVDYFMRSIAICKEIGNELEVAKSYRAFSSYVFSSPHYRHNADIQREAHKLESMAEEIFERHRLGAAS